MLLKQDKHSQLLVYPSRSKVAEQWRKISVNFLWGRTYLVDLPKLAYNLAQFSFQGSLLKAESCSSEHYPKNLMRIIPTKGEKR